MIKILIVTATLLLLLTGCATGPEMNTESNEPDMAQIYNSMYCMSDQNGRVEADIPSKKWKARYHCKSGVKTGRYQIIATPSASDPFAQLKQTGGNDSKPTVVERGEFKDNLLHGLQTLYRLDGSVQSKGRYSNGLRSGKFKFYYPTGQLSQVLTFEAGTAQGSVKTYYRNGKLKAAGRYVNNQLQGKFKVYYPDKRLKRLYLFRGGEIRYPIKTYSQKGNLIELTRYNSKKNIGMVMELHPNGELAKKYRFRSKGMLRHFQIKDDLKEGKLVVDRFFKERDLETNKRFAELTELPEDMLFNLREKHGSFREYSRFGELQRKCEYQNGVQKTCKDK